MWNRNRKADRTAIAEEAKRHVGYRAQPERRSAFQLKPYLGQPWSGTFVDRVLHDAFGDFAEVRFLSTVAALSYYVKRNRVYRKPQVGSIVFYNFSSDPLYAFEQPHVGVVTEVKPNGAFLAVEGETAPGTPQGSQLPDGVFERARTVDDALGFVRPVPLNRNRTGETEKLKMSYFESNPKTKARAVATVQRALNRYRPEWSFTAGKKDRETRSRFGVFARESGWPANRGEMQVAPLQALSDTVGVFVVDS